MTASWRCFVAVRLDEVLRASLSEAVAAWRHQPPADVLRWADGDGWHLTLAFLGSVSPDEAVAASRAVSAVAAVHAPFRVETGRLGAFHRAGSARTLWYAVADHHGRLTTLAGDLARALDLEVEAPYRPHITLARARRGPVDLRGWIEPASVRAPAGRLTVADVHLMRSHLGTGPARYETLASMPLTGASHD